MSAERALRRAAWLLALLLPAVTAGADDEPDPALIEFLGAWEAEDEGWLDAAVATALDEAEPAGEPADRAADETEEADDDAP
jgi:hypothetical protein